MVFDNPHDVTNWANKVEYVVHWNLQRILWSQLGRPLFSPIEFYFLDDFQEQITRQLEDQIRLRFNKL